MSTLAEIAADPRVGQLVPLAVGAYLILPAAPCPCGAFSRDSEWHRDGCRDRVEPGSLS